MSAEHHSSFGYKPALDGLRAVAVGSVMAYHFSGFSDGSMPGGFLGVDTFFVLSGYLITSLLLHEWQGTGTLKLSAFWIRRAKRLFPALLIALTAVTVWAGFAIQSDRLGAFRADGLWTLFYGANWHFIASGQSYFDLFNEASPLRHAWSLAIEEQFYVFWPLITFGLLRLGRGRPRFLGAVCVAGIVGSAFLLSNLYDADDPSRAYYGTDSRASQLLVGALLAIALTRWSPRSRGSRAAVQVMGYVGAALCVWAFAASSDTDSWLYNGGYLGFAFATAAVITAIVQPGRSPLTALLALRPVRWIGQVSYGLYLWHWPVQIAISEARTGITGWTLAVLRIAVTFIATTLSYYLIERPIRFGALKGWTARVAAPAAALAVAVVIIIATAGATTAPPFLATDPGKVLTVGPTPTSSATTTPTDPATPVPTTPEPTSFLLGGDSLASSLGDALSSEAATRGLTFAAATRPGCNMTTAVPLRRDGTVLPWIPNCSQLTAGYQERAIAQYPSNVVLWLSSWEASDHLYDGKRLDFNTPEGDAALLADFEQSRQRLTANGATLVMLTLPGRAEKSDLGTYDAYNERLYLHLNKLFREFAAENPDTVEVVDLARIVCPPGPPCPKFVDGVRLRPRDGGHYSAEGATWVATRLFDAVIAAFVGASPEP